MKSMRFGVRVLLAVFLLVSSVGSSSVLAKPLGLVNTARSATDSATGRMSWEERKAAIQEKLEQRKTEIQNRIELRKENIATRVAEGKRRLAERRKIFRADAEAFPSSSGADEAVGRPD